MAEARNKKLTAEKKRKIIDPELNALLGRWLGEPRLAYLRNEIRDPGSGSALKRLVQVSFLCRGYIRDKRDFASDMMENIATDDLRLRETEIILDFKLARLCNRLPRKERDMLVDLTEGYYNLGVAHHRDPPSNDILSIPPPKDKNEADTRYLNGPSSIRENLPTPQVLQQEEKFAYSSVTESFKILLARGTTMEPIDLDPERRLELLSESGPSTPYSWITDTPRAAEIHEQAAARMEGGRLPASAVVYGYFIWQDGIDPNKTKKNRLSVWIKSMTVGTQKDNRNDRRNTCLLALAEGKGAHLDVEEKLEDEMTKLRTGEAPLMFSKTAGGPVKVFADVYAILADQPERRGANELALGGQLYHARFRCSADHGKLMSYLRPCQTCTGQLRAGTLPAQCGECVVWDALAPDTWEAAKKLGLPPSHAEYPKEGTYPDAATQAYFLDGPGGTVKPFLVTYARLKKAKSLAYQQVLTGAWNVAATTAFLTRECFNDTFAKDITGSANRERSLRQKTAGSIDHGVLSAHKHEEPHMCAGPRDPVPWSLYSDPSIYVDVLMHLLFLGVVKTTITMLAEWMSSQGKNAEFLRRSVDKNKLLQALKIDWIKWEDYGAFGAWVSESYMGFSRVMLWFYQDLDKFEVGGADSRHEDAPPTEKPDKSWTKRHYEWWLKDRGMKAQRLSSDGKEAVKGQPLLADVARAVLEEIEKEGGARVPVEAKRKFDSAQVERTLVALDLLLVSVMCKEVIPGTTIREMELAVKRFLTEFDLLDQQIKTAADRPRVVSVHNLLCLLNLPELTRRYGPLRNLWEGGWKGE
jgi:hypothetical protein